MEGGYNTMGWIGYGPYENDDAMDWLGDVVDMLRFIITQACFSKEYGTVMAACRLMVDLPKPLRNLLGVYPFHEAEAALDAILRDKAWLDLSRLDLSNKPGKMEKAIRHLRDNVIRINKATHGTGYKKRMRLKSVPALVNPKRTVRKLKRG